MKAVTREVVQAPEGIWVVSSESAVKRPQSPKLASARLVAHAESHTSGSRPRLSRVQAGPAHICYICLASVATPHKVNLETELWTDPARCGGRNLRLSYSIRIVHGQ